MIYKIYKTRSKQEKHQLYVASIRDRIESLKNQKAEIQKELVELQTKLLENENYVPEE
ncbi:hypothetical protein [uncultured Nostoc sp.]|uniref:hypothetical protein n=1 Tax=uncultured Nostoc sp. TaxID=340711 RepID=UPI0035CB547A